MKIEEKCKMFFFYLHEINFRHFFCYDDLKYDIPHMFTFVVPFSFLVSHEEFVVANSHKHTGRLDFCSIALTSETEEKHMCLE